MDPRGLEPIDDPVRILEAGEPMGRAVAVDELNPSVRAPRDRVRVVGVDVDRVAEAAKARNRERPVVSRRRVRMVLQAVVGEADDRREAPAGRVKWRPVQDRIAVGNVEQRLHPTADTLSDVLVVLLESQRHAQRLGHDDRIVGWLVAFDGEPRSCGTVVEINAQRIECRVNPVVKSRRRDVDLDV